jgi:glutathione peroxidase
MTACFKALHTHQMMLPQSRHKPMGKDHKQSAYDFEFESIEGGRMPLSDFRGQVLLIVNTASKCAFTTQFGPLRELYKKYGGYGFSVIGVPSNDFQQEPEDGPEIKRYCQVSHMVNFPLTAKTHVRGKNAHPFYQWAKKQGGLLSYPSWNFHKYLIGTDGQLLSWHFASTSPLSRRITLRIEQQIRYKP